MVLGVREGKMTAMGDKTYATSNVRELYLAHCGGWGVAVSVAKPVSAIALNALSQSALLL